MMNSMAAHEWRGESNVHDRLEAAEKLIEQLEATQRELVEALEKLLSVTRHLGPCSGTMDEVEVVLDKLRNQK